MTEPIKIKKDVKESGNEVKKSNLRYQRDKNRELVKGIFHNHEIPGGEVSFVYREFKGDKIEKHTFLDNHTYKIPLGVARHLNKRAWYPVHKYALGEDGKSTMKIGQKVNRFSFQSLEFVDIADFSTEVSQIVTVEKVA